MQNARELHRFATHSKETLYINRKRTCALMRLAHRQSVSSSAPWR